MINEKSLVSVIVPTYNAQEYIVEAIESILAQSYDPLEIIIIDDGSTDNTEKILIPYLDRIHYVFQKNAGPAAARNLGIKMACGEFIAFADADDLWPDDKLIHQLEPMLSNIKLEIVVGQQKVQYLDNAQEILHGDELILEPQISQGMPVTVARKSTFEKIGYFDESLLYFEDWDWHLRARERALNILALENIVNIHRRHATNMTHDMRKMNRYVLQLFRKALARRREDPSLKTDLPTLSELIIK